MRRNNPFIFALALLCSLIAGEAKAQKTVPQDSLAKWMRQGSAALKEDKYGEAIGYFSSVTYYDSLSLAAWHFRGNCYYKLQNYYLAEKDLKRVYLGVKDPASKYHFAGYAQLAKNKTAKNKAANVDLRATYLPIAAEGVNRLALIEAERTHYSLAIEYHDAAVTADPKSAYFRAERAATLVAAGQFAKAVKDYLKAAEMKYKPADMYGGAGYAYSRMNDNKTALQYLDKAIAMDSTVPILYFHRAFARIETGQFDAAIKDLLTYLPSEPRDALAFYTLGRAYAGKKAFPKAINSLKTAMDMNPELPDGWRQLGLAYGETGDYAAAVSAFDQAIAQDPKNGILYYNRALAKAGMGSRMDPCPDLQQAVQNGYTAAQEMKTKLCK